MRQRAAFRARLGRIAQVAQISAPHVAKEHILPVSRPDVGPDRLTGLTSAKCKFSNDKWLQNDVKKDSRAVLGIGFAQSSLL